MEGKVVEDAASYIRSLAGKRGRNVRWPRTGCARACPTRKTRRSTAASSTLSRRSEEELVARLDGRTVRRFDGSELSWPASGKPVVDLPMTFRQRFLLTIANPNLAYILLLMLGLLGLYFEFSHPGAISGRRWAAFRSSWPSSRFQILPINYVGLALILLAIASSSPRSRSTSYGFLTLGGIAAMIIGSLHARQVARPRAPPGPGRRPPRGPRRLARSSSSSSPWSSRPSARRPATGREGMVGETGTARTDLVPGGQGLRSRRALGAPRPTGPSARRKNQGRPGPRRPEDHGSSKSEQEGE